MNQPEEHKDFKPAKARLGFIGGFLGAIVITWFAYILKELSIPLAGPSAYHLFSGQWDIIALPGMVLAALFGADVYKDFSQDFTFVGVCLITLANAVFVSLAKLAQPEPSSLEYPLRSSPAF